MATSGRSSRRPAPRARPSWPRCAPCSPPRSGRPVPAKLSPAESVAGRGTVPRILIVEDDELNRDSLRRLLRRRGFEILLAVDGNEGVEVARTEAPDLILMDMSLPGIDGWE